MFECFKNNSIFDTTKNNLVMNTCVNNGQSAAKPLSVKTYEKGSTTIPWEGSTLNKVETAHIKHYSLTDKLSNESGVYAIYCKSNNKLYIGSAVNFHARLKRHLYHLRNDKHHSIKLQRAFNKYEIENFIFIILENVDKSELLDKESYWINHLNSYKNGFNCTDVCKKPKNFKLTSKQIQKRIQKSSKPVVCLTIDGEYICTYPSVSKAAMSIGEQSTNISACCKGKLNYVKDFIFVYESEYRLGNDYSYKPKPKVFSETHRLNISKAVKGLPKNKKQIELLVKRSSKPVNKLDLEGNILKQYSSIKECCNNNQLCDKTLKKHIVSQTLLGGFRYKFNEDIV